MGIPLDVVSHEDTLRRIEEGLSQGNGGAVLTPNIDILRQCHRSEPLRAALESIELLVADGVPVVWASRLQGTPVPARITGTDMLWGAAELAARNEIQLFVAGGRPDVGPRAAQQLRHVHPTLRVASHPCFVRPGPMDGQVADLAEELKVSAPKLVLIALPFAAQVFVIMTMRPRLPSTWFIGIGSSCDFVNGDRPRAPEWLQRIGLEWAHRVAHEPHTARRYLIDGLPFAGQLAAHALTTRLRGAVGWPAPTHLEGAL
jgi:N-acetylglucosaminyldiphosphoundecaprenol N-acetyl-beta-D-mannosaminyltransferase